MLGFVEPYRDPYSVRAEWEGAICISNLVKTGNLKALVNSPRKHTNKVCRAVPGKNDGKGPFGISLFQAPDSTIMHGE